MASLSGDIPLLIHRAQDRAGASRRPWIIFVHHYGGSETSTQRHVSVLNGMGFDCVSFSLSLHGRRRWRNLRLELSFLSDRWSREIDWVMAQLDREEPGRRKILYAFSGPSASALRSIARKFKNGSRDVMAYVCDSGPFIDATECTRRMIREVEHVTNPVLIELRLAVMMFMWGPEHNEKLKKSVAAVAAADSQFPILSFRGIRDTIVPIEKIRAVFDGSPLKNVTAAELECGHLTGLRDRPDPYKAALTDFFAHVCGNG